MTKTEANKFLADNRRLLPKGTRWVSGALDGGPVAVLSERDKRYGVQFSDSAGRNGILRFSEATSRADFETGFSTVRERWIERKAAEGERTWTVDVTAGETEPVPATKTA